MSRKVSSGRPRPQELSTAARGKRPRAATRADQARRTGSLRSPPATARVQQATSCRYARWARTRAGTNAACCPCPPTTHTRARPLLDTTPPTHANGGTATQMARLLGTYSRWHERRLLSVSTHDSNQVVPIAQYYPTHPRQRGIATQMAQLLTRTRAGTNAACCPCPPTTPRGRTPTRTCWEPFNNSSVAANSISFGDGPIALHNPAPNGKRGTLTQMALVQGTYLAMPGRRSNPNG